MSTELPSEQVSSGPETMCNHQGSIHIPDGQRQEGTGERPGGPRAPRGAKPVASLGQDSVLRPSLATGKLERLSFGLGSYGGGGGEKNSGVLLPRVKGEWLLGSDWQP